MKTMAKYADNALREVTHNVRTEGQHTRDYVSGLASNLNRNVRTESQRTRDHASGLASNLDSNSATRHAETQSVVRAEGDSIRRHIDAARDFLEAPDIIVGVILGIIAAIMLWNFEKDIIVKTILDEVGNVISTEPNYFLLGVLSLLLGIVVCDVAAAITHAIRRRIDN